MAYLPIEDYGIIGNLRTAALVGRSGSIDWWCDPHFDSPSVFAAILDDAAGGRFRIGPVGGGLAGTQAYVPDTNVLRTRFATADGVAELTDFMPVRVPGGDRARRLLVRRVEVPRGELSLRLDCRPAFDYAREGHRVALEPGGARFLGGRGRALALASSVPLARAGAGVTAEFTLRAGERRTFLLAAADDGDEGLATLAARDPDRMLEETIRYWKGWTAGARYRGRWRDAVIRSALALKLLTFEPTGAVVAAPTCSLPERIGGGRNWDYRYTWIRDASFTLRGLIRVGFLDEARRFMEWLVARVRETPAGEGLQVLYSIDGTPGPAERTLDHLSGYRDSRPVRVGNDAVRQVQMDLYGELMDAVYLFDKHHAAIGEELWVDLRRLLDWLADHWRDPDDGIWEVRGGRRHFVHSKLMCWVAFDRGLRLADKRSLGADRDRWIRARDAIRREILERGWSESRRSFVQSYGSDVLDASSLLLSVTFFLPPNDPRMVETLRAVRERLATGGLVRRYDPGLAEDGVGGPEGAFGACSFWLVDALTRAGRLEESRAVFEETLGHANHLGLFAEEIAPEGRALGNFPQAFTHLGLINAAVNLDRAMGSKGA
ncbi:MAG TPA: glycoside hydrolase family 15 protein [Candidatus Eisenbacteria bacterium]